MGMEYKRIHACPNNCILYRKRFQYLKKMFEVWFIILQAKTQQRRQLRDKKGWSHFESSLVPSIIPKLKHLFVNPKDVKNLIWHAYESLLRYPTGLKQWKNIDQQFPQFNQEYRNLQLGLTTNEMN